MQKSLEKSSDINQNCMSILQIKKKNYVKFEFLSQKTLFLGQKVRKSLEKFGNRVFQTFRNFGNCSIPKFQKLHKMTLNLNLKNFKKLVPTRKTTQKFG